MSTPDVNKELQERLREACAIGDIDEVQTLVESRVNVNSKNEMNGWTGLHWASRRNHSPIVEYLLNAGADRDVLTSKGELAVQLTSNTDIRRLLGVEDDIPEMAKPDLPIIPHYLSNPPFLYSKTDTHNLILESHSLLNRTVVQAGDPHPESLQSRVPPSTWQSLATDIGVEQNGVSVSSHGVSVEPTGDSGHCSNHSEHAPAVVQNSPTCCPLPSANGSASSFISSQQTDPQQRNLTPAGGPLPSVQPLFFTRTLPVNVQELVLKVRIQNPNAKENDFIEVELDRQELTYRSLLRVCCRELDIRADHVDKIRKLPDTILRKDKDVARLLDFQELEVVLGKKRGRDSTFGRRMGKFD